METDDSDESAGFETIVKDARERCFELFELVVDGDPQGLKDARGGMSVTLPARSTGRWPVRRPRSGDRVGQVQPGANWPELARFDNAAGHATAVRFLSIALEQLAKLPFVESRDECRRGFSLCDVKPQIERTVGGKT
jgi:hypothetical protein